MPVLTSPNLKLFYPLDESMPSGTRRNYGSLGSAHDLSASQSSGTDGIPTVSDGRGGRQLDIFTFRTGYTTAQRGVRGTAFTGSAHPLRQAYPIASAALDFAYGGRFTYLGLNTAGGANEIEHVFGLKSASANIGNWGMAVTPDSASAPTAGKLRLYHASGQEVVDAYTTTGSPPAFTFLVGQSYRLVFRVFFNSTGYRIKVYVIKESTGDIFTFTRAADLAVVVSAGFDAAADVRIWGSVHNDASMFPFGGYLDECWFYGAPMTEAEALDILTGGLSVPYEAPTYRRVAHKLYSSVTREGGTFPKPRPLPTGMLIGGHPCDLLCHEARWHLEGHHAGRPWALNTVDVITDQVGPFSSRGGGPQRVPNVNAGLWRSPGPKPNGVLEDARNVVHTEQGPRRRQGFKVRRSVSTDSSTALNSFHSFRTYDGSLYWLYKVGTKLYYDTGAGVVQLDTGWSPSQAVCAFFHDNRLVILSGARQKMWDGQVDGVDSIGQAAPTVLTLAVGVGGTLSGTFFYAYTEYDPLTGDESAPKVSAASVSPVVQKVTLTMDAALGGRWTHRRIYRTTNGGSSPDLFFITQITSAATFDDTGLADGTELVDQVNGSFITSAAPDTFSLGCTHKERIFYGGGATFPERIYVTEPNEVMRWYSSFFLVCEGPVRCLIGYGNKLVAFTDHTTEIFESDWVRDEVGNVNVEHNVISRDVGAYGPNAAIVREGQLCWMDFGGIYHLEGGEPEPISGRIQDLFPYVNRTLARHVRAGYNHVRRQLWWTLPHGTLQDDTTRFQTQFFVNAPSEDEDNGERRFTRWGIASLEACWVGQFDDDVNGMKFGLMDHLGVMKELEAYEGDGAQGDEAFTIEDEGTDGVTNVGIKSISGSVVTVFGSPGWATDGLRGMSFLAKDRSTGRLYYYTILSNTSGVDPAVTVERVVDSALAARDGWFVGGIPAFAEGAGQDQNSPNRKVVREIQYGLSDLTSSLYL